MHKTGKSNEIICGYFISNSEPFTSFRQIGPITYEDQFIQFTVRLSSRYLYGFGESLHATLQHNFSPRSTYSMFSRDEPPGRVSQSCQHDTACDTCM